MCACACDADSSNSACLQRTHTLYVLSTFCHISLMVAFNSVLFNFFFFWMSHLFLFYPNTFPLVDMSSIITLPQSEWLNLLGTRIYICSNVCCGFPLSFHCCLFLTSSWCLALSSHIRHFSMISLPYLSFLIPFPPPLFLCLCFLPPPRPLLLLSSLSQHAPVSFQWSWTIPGNGCALTCTIRRKDLLNCRASCIDDLFAQIMLLSFLWYKWWGNACRLQVR